MNYIASQNGTCFFASIRSSTGGKVMNELQSYIGGENNWAYNWQHSIKVVIDTSILVLAMMP